MNIFVNANTIKKKEGAVKNINTKQKREEKYYEKSKTNHFINIIFITLMLLSACTSLPKEKNVKEDLKIALGEDEIIDNMEIIDRKTDKDARTDIFYFTVESNDGKIAYTRYYIVTYVLYEECWCRDDIYPNTNEECLQKPLTGIDEQDIPASLNGKSVFAN